MTDKFSLVTGTPPFPHEQLLTRFSLKVCFFRATCQSLLTRFSLLSNVFGGLRTGNLENKFFRAHFYPTTNETKLGDGSVPSTRGDHRLCCHRVVNWSQRRAVLTSTGNLLNFSEHIKSLVHHSVYCWDRFDYWTRNVRVMHCLWVGIRNHRVTLQFECVLNRKVQFVLDLWCSIHFIQDGIRVFTNITASHNCSWPLGARARRD